MMRTCAVALRRLLQRAPAERALLILGHEVPDHLRYAGELRVLHKHASLDELVVWLIRR